MVEATELPPPRHREGPPCTRLWDDADLAAFLHLGVDDVADVAAQPGAPSALQLGRARRWVPAHWHEWTGCTSEPVSTESLWAIGDVAAFMGMCENTTRNVLRTERDVPGPVLEGRHRRWDPRSWWAWAERRAQARAGVAAPARSSPSGRTTRV